ncbi:MAG: hypothetical protein H0V41_04990 [Pseudonocardiales bacterium]|nr:hypothetical protein [Pseudonocardiales bacterium]
MISRRNAALAVAGVLAALVTTACGGGGSAAPSPSPSSAPPTSRATTSPAPARPAVAIPTCGPVKVPPLDAANFPDSTNIDNKWFPLVPGTQFVMEGRANRDGGVLPHQIVSTVTDLTKVINGVPTVVIWEVDRDNGTLAESELSFFAQDRDGNVWNFGQYPELYTNGNFTGAPKTWFAGLSRADAGVLVRGGPQLGSTEYLQGVAPDVEFLDCAKNVKTAERTCVPTNCYDGVAVVDERSGDDPSSGIQRKYYAPGVGGVRVEAVGDPEDETLVLAKLVTPNPDTVAAARQAALDLEKHAYQVSAVYRATPPVTPRR